MFWRIRSVCCNRAPPLLRVLCEAAQLLALAASCSLLTHRLLRLPKLPMLLIQRITGETARLVGWAQLREP